MKVMETSEGVLGEDHPDTFTSMANLAATYRNQGWQMEAEELGAKATETRKRLLSQEHPGTLISLAGLAYTLKPQGRVAAVIKMLTLAANTYAGLFGNGHPSSRVWMSTLKVWKGKTPGDNLGSRSAVWRPSRGLVLKT